MQEAKKLNIIKISIIAAIVSAILLALTAVTPSIADLVNNNLSSGSEFALETTKTTKWDEGSTSSGQIEIKADVTGQKTDDLDILFIGTCCDVHGLEKSTIKASLDSIQDFADVDWFLFNNGSNYEVDDVYGHLDKGGVKFLIMVVIMKLMMWTAILIRVGLSLILPQICMHCIQETIKRFVSF